jgi:hypothetical protein
MRFRKRVKIFPGFSLNFSGSGVSATLGPKGANINFSKRGSYFNGSIPGTGLYDRIKIGPGSSIKTPQTSITPNIYNDILDDLPIPKSPFDSSQEIKSGEIDEMTSSSLKELKETLAEAYADLHSLPTEIEVARKKWIKAKNLNLISKIMIFGFFSKGFKDRVEERLFDMECLQDQLSNTHVDIDIHFDESIAEKYNDVKNSFEELTRCQFLWDKTSTSSVDLRERSAAGKRISREKVSFNIEDVLAIKTSYPGLKLENKNGGDMYLYPGFVIMIDSVKNFALVDIRELTIHGTISKFLEEETIPTDSEQIGTTWAKVNNDGSRDRRFVGNYQIPIIQYGVFSVKSATGLEESYMVSNWKAVQKFCEAFDVYQKGLLPMKAG